MVLPVQSIFHHLQQKFKFWKKSFHVAWQWPRRSICRRKEKKIWNSLWIIMKWLLCKCNPFLRNFNLERGHNFDKILLLDFMTLQNFSFQENASKMMTILFDFEIEHFVFLFKFCLTLFWFDFGKCQLILNEWNTSTLFEEYVKVLNVNFVTTLQWQTTLSILHKNVFLT